MSDLPSRILNALDEAVAQEVGARLRQVAQNVPRGRGAPVLPDHFEQSLQRLRTLHAQVKVIVRKTFGEGGATDALLGLAMPQDSPALKMLDAPSPKRTAGPAVRKKKRDAKELRAIPQRKKRIGADRKKHRRATSKFNKR
jgi:hypothetical protein